MKRKAKRYWSTSESIKARWKEATGVRNARTRGSSAVYQWERILGAANEREGAYVFALNWNELIAGE